LKADIALAFDIGGSFLKAALVDTAGRIQKEERLPLPSGTDEAVAALTRLAETLTEGGRQALAGIGIGAPGAIDHAGCAIGADAGNLPQLIGVQFDEVFSLYAVPVRIDNDATNAARGEYFFGAARGMPNALIITLGTGIGGGLILNGEIYSGADSYAGEFGHVIVQANGRRCTCGGYGCVEAYASAWALRLRAGDLVRRCPESSLASLAADSSGTALSKTVIEVADIMAAAGAGDALALAITYEAADMLGIALASAANLLNLSAVVIGGGVAAAGETLFAPLRASFRRNALPRASAACTLIPAELGNRAGLAGAAALIFGKGAAKA
jgi:glucokinase